MLDMYEALVFSEVAEDAQVLLDLLRAHFPGIKVKYCGKRYEDTSGEGLVVLHIKRMPTELGFEVRIYCEGSEYTHLEKSRDEVFSEPEINRERRMLRLAVFRALAGVFEGKEQFAGLSPWGVLTGVRPTKIARRLFEEGFATERVLRHLVLDYAISSEKAVLVTTVVQGQTAFIPDKKEAKKAIGIYLGIPFCPSRCHYCSFPAVSIKKMGHLLADYLEGLKKEISVVAAAVSERNLLVQTVYIGGGTPTVLSAQELRELLLLVKQSFSLRAGAEITVEAGRPDTLNEDKLRVMKELGVGRVSVNPQTMQDDTLKRIGRGHTVEDIFNAYELVRKAGIAVINMDLIVGLPGETVRDVEESVRSVVNLGPENITLHALAIKRAALYRQSGIKLPGLREGSTMMAITQKVLQEAGYRPYYLYRQKESVAQGENVGYALPGTECLYNIEMIEERRFIIGFGVGAGSKFINVRDWSLHNQYNPKDIGVYLARLDDIAAMKVDKVNTFVYNNF